MAAFYWIILFQGKVKVPPLPSPSHHVDDDAMIMLSCCWKENQFPRHVPIFHHQHPWTLNGCLRSAICVCNKIHVFLFLLVEFLFRISSGYNISKCYVFVWVCLVVSFEQRKFIPSSNKVPYFINFISSVKFIHSSHHPYNYHQLSNPTKSRIAFQ